MRHSTRRTLIFPPHTGVTKYHSDLASLRGACCECIVAKSVGLLYKRFLFHFDFQIKPAPPTETKTDERGRRKLFTQGGNPRGTVLFLKMIIFPKLLWPEKFSPCVFYFFESSNCRLVVVDEGCAQWYLARGPHFLLRTYFRYAITWPNLLYFY